MAAKRFIRLVTGRLTEILGTLVSTGAPNDGDIPALDATGRLDISMMPIGVVPMSKIIVASENLSAGDLINVHNSGGARVRRADGVDPAKYAQGFVLTSVLAAANATVFFEDVNTSSSGLTVGDRLYLSNVTPGGVINTPPATAGHIVQPIGVALSATEYSFEWQEPVTLA